MGNLVALNDNRFVVCPRDEILIINGETGKIITKIPFNWIMRYFYMEKKNCLVCYSYGIVKVFSMKDCFVLYESKDFIPVPKCHLLAQLDEDTFLLSEETTVHIININDNFKRTTYKEESYLRKGCATLLRDKKTILFGCEQAKIVFFNLEKSVDEQNSNSYLMSTINPLRCFVQKIFIIDDRTFITWDRRKIQKFKY